ncbi:MAG: nucleotidyltransferase family protein [Bacteroidales bacterium]|jgi:D-glycero-alpha-D-manno-heptose 1-phosphate guanylyltransferase|nr:nucleotidyltransferase family protein [Bacteroidales bacterium]
MDTIILAGGFGTRLQSVVSDLPKPMAPVQNRPFLEYQLDYLKQSGINDVILSVGYLHDVVIRHFGDCYNDIRLKYAIENHPLGTGGGIKFATSLMCGEDALVLNGDSFFNINIEKFHSFYEKYHPDILLALKYMDDLSRYGGVEIDNEGNIVAFREKGLIKDGGYINGGIYLFNKNILNDFPERFSFEKELLENPDGLKVMGLPFDSDFIDIGIPEDYNKIQSWNWSQLK